jgi:hypothetical protein
VFRVEPFGSRSCIAGLRGERPRFTPVSPSCPLPKKTSSRPPEEPSAERAARPAPLIDSYPKVAREGTAVRRGCAPAALFTYEGDADG